MKCMVLIGQAVLEKIFENGGRTNNNRWMPDHAYMVLTLPDGCELKTKKQLF